MKIINESLTSENKEKIEYSAIILCELFFNASQNSDPILAGKNIDNVVDIWSKTFIQFLQKEKMWLNGKTLMGNKDKDIRVRHFVNKLINSLK